MMPGREAEKTAADGSGGRWIPDCSGCWGACQSSVEVSMCGGGGGGAAAAEQATQRRKGSNLTAAAELKRVPLWDLIYYFLIHVRAVDQQTLNKTGHKRIHNS